MKSNSTRYWIIILAATAAAIVLRAMIACNGSIWADEGTFLNVVAAPSTSEMLEFLKSHESHPPLFYLLMRGWSRVAGGSDGGLLLVPVLLGAAIVPAIFVAGRTLFSEKVGVIAALIAVGAPQLTEHSAQLRPYGLLSLFALGSSAAFAMGLTSPTRRAWIVYVLSTAGMLYTHNWGWLILGGEFGAALLVLWREPLPDRRRVLRGLALSWLAIAALYSVWIPSFMYQTGHAGHGRLPIENIVDYIGYLVFSVSVILESLIVGRHGDREIVAIVSLAVAILAAGWTILRYRRRESVSHDRGGSVRLKICINVALFALLAALIVSPFNNLILPRSVATVVPMLLLATACWIDRLLTRSAPRREAQLAAAVLGFACVAAVFETTDLLMRPRSNAHMIADAVRANSNENDLLIVAPEWFAPAFDHYFPPSIEQIDYPYEGRSGMIDFSNIWQAQTQSTAASMVRKKIENASRGGRRVWLVVERRYLRTVRPDELASAYRNKTPNPITAHDVQRILTTLNSIYGKPQRIFEANNPQPINDELLAYLYAH